MKFLYNYIFKVLGLALIIYSAVFADNYPRNTAIDVQHYTFKLSLSDSTDSITGEADIEIKFVNSGSGKFSLDPG